MNAEQTVACTSTVRISSLCTGISGEALYIRQPFNAAAVPCRSLRTAAGHRRRQNILRDDDFHTGSGLRPTQCQHGHGGRAAGSGQVKMLALLSRVVAAAAPGVGDSADVRVLALSCSGNWRGNDSMILKAARVARGPGPACGHDSVETLRGHLLYATKYLNLWRSSPCPE